MTNIRYDLGHISCISWAHLNNMPEICPRYAQGMPKICQRYAQDMHEICTRYAWDMPEICPRYAQDMTKICLICQRYDHQDGPDKTSKPVRLKKMSHKSVLTKRLPDKTSKLVLTKRLPDKTSKAVLTKCLPDKTSADRIFLLLLMEDIDYRRILCSSSYYRKIFGCSR